MLTNPPRMEISEELLYIDKRLVLAVRFHRSIQGNFFNHFRERSLFSNRLRRRSMPLLEGSSMLVSPISAKRNHVKMNHDDHGGIRVPGTPVLEQKRTSETIRKREKSRFFASRLASQFKRAARRWKGERGAEKKQSMQLRINSFLRSTGR